MSHMTTNQYTSHGIPNDQWQLIITSFRTRYGIDVGVRHILVLDTFLLLPTCHLEPYDIYYVIWVDAD